MKLDSHESNFINYKDGLVEEEMWLAMLSVLKADFEILEFRRTWTNAKRFYELTFVEYVDTLIRNS